MADEPDKLSSPACALNEADDLYRGFLPPADIQALIQRWIAASPTTEIATALSALLIEMTSSEAEKIVPAKPPEPIPSARLQDEIKALLPQIRDDKMHRILKSIALRL